MVLAVPNSGRSKATQCTHTQTIVGSFDLCEMWECGPDGKQDRVDPTHRTSSPLLAIVTSTRVPDYVRTVTLVLVLLLTATASSFQICYVRALLFFSLARILYNPESVRE